MNDEHGGDDSIHKNENNTTQSTSSNAHVPAQGSVYNAEMPEPIADKPAAPHADLAPGPSINPDSLKEEAASVTAPGESISPFAVGNETTPAQPKPSLRKEDFLTQSPQPEIPAIDPIALAAAAQKKPKSKKRIMIAGLVLLVLLAGGIAYYLMNRVSENVTETPAAQAPKTIERLSVGSHETDFTKLYPDISGVGMELDINRQIWEPLVRFENINKPSPALAESWKNEGTDNTVWVFKLKENVKFLNGNPVTATAVKASLEKAGESEALGVYLDTIQSIEAVSDTELKITTVAPDPLLLNRLTNLLIQDTSVAATPVPNLETGTGAYQLKEGTTFDATSTELTLVPVENWHGGDVLTKELIFKKYDSLEALREATNKKEIDIANIYDAEPIADPGSVGLKTWDIPTIGASYMLFNTTKDSAVADNLKFRQAVSAAVDRPAIIKASESPDKPLSQLVPQTVTGYNPEIPEATRDLDKAKALLAESGYKTTTKFEIGYAENLSGVALEIEKQLEEAGITVELVEVDINDDPIAATLNQNPDATLIGYSSDLVDLSDVVSSFFRSDSAYFPWYNNDQVNTLYDESNGLFDASKRLEKLQEMNKLIIDDAAAVVYRNFTDRLYIPTELDLNRQSPSGIIGVYFWRPF